MHEFGVVFLWRHLYLGLGNLSLMFAHGRESIWSKLAQLPAATYTAASSRFMVAMKSTELQALTRRIYLAEKRLKRSLARQKRTCETHSRETLLVLIWGGHDMEAAVQFLRKQKTTPIPLDVEEVETEILRMYAECHATALVRLVMEPPARDAAKAADFLVQYRLWLWTRLQNRKGVAPGRLHLMRQATKEIPVGIPAAAAQMLLRRFQGAPRLQRHWCRKFRLRWKARLGRLPLHPAIPEAELREKAPVAFCLFYSLSPLSSASLLDKERPICFTPEMGVQNLPPKEGFGNSPKINVSFFPALETSILGVIFVSPF